MKLINYKCKKCSKEKEEIFESSELAPKTIKCSCGARMVQYNFKNNNQRVFIYDPQGK